MAALCINGGRRLLGQHIKTGRLKMTADRWSSLTQACSRVATGINSLISRLYGSGTEKKTFTVAVEGNIGSGKTTLLRHFAGTSCAEVLQEPVSKWRNINGQNALALLYTDQKRWSLTLQTYVQLTMLENHLAKQQKPVKMMERSIYSAMYCFAENLHQSGTMPDIEYTVLKRWFDWIISHNDCHVDLIVYLRTCPETIHKRIRERCRKEEQAIPIEYLRSLHELHEEWLLKQSKFSVSCPVLVLDGNKDEEEMIKVYEAHRHELLGGHT